MKDKQEDTIAQLKHIIKDLEQKNEELEQFVSHATHDMKEPLRSIAIGSEILLKKHKAHLDDEAIKMLDFMLASAKRFETIIADLKNYTKADSGKLHIEAIDLNKLIADVLKDLHIIITATQATVEVNSLPHINNDTKKLQLVFRHVIENALKYKSAKPAHIHISCKENKEAFIIAIKDNGIGIDAKHHERILKPFERLHSKFELPGNGLGLPLSIKILKRLRGVLWFESAEGAGSTFYVQLMK